MNSYEDEFKYLLLAAVFGGLLLIPRILQIHNIGPDPYVLIHSQVNRYLPSHFQFLRRGSPSPASSRPANQKSGVWLDGIVQDARGGASAVVNDLIVKSGDTIAGYAVLEVRAREVVLEKEGVRYLLSKEAGLTKEKAA